MATTFVTRSYQQVKDTYVTYQGVKDRNSSYGDLREYAITDVGTIPSTAQAYGIEISLPASIGFIPPATVVNGVHLDWVMNDVDCLVLGVLDDLAAPTIELHALPVGGESG